MCQEWHTAGRPFRVPPERWVPPHDLFPCDIHRTEDDEFHLSAHLVLIPHRDGSAFRVYTVVIPHVVLYVEHRTHHLVAYFRIYTDSETLCVVFIITAALGLGLVFLPHVVLLLAVAGTGRVRSELLSRSLLHHALVAHDEHTRQDGHLRQLVCAVAIRAVLILVLLRTFCRVGYEAWVSLYVGPLVPGTARYRCRLLVPVLAGVVSSVAVVAARHRLVPIIGERLRMFLLVQESVVECRTVVRHLHQRVQHHLARYHYIVGHHRVGRRQHTARHVARIFRAGYGVLDVVCRWPVLTLRVLAVAVGRYHHVVGHADARRGRVVRAVASLLHLTRAHYQRRTHHLAQHVYQLRLVCSACQLQHVPAVWRIEGPSGMILHQCEPVGHLCSFVSCLTLVRHHTHDTVIRSPALTVGAILRQQQLALAVHTL